MHKVGANFFRFITDYTTYLTPISRICLHMLGWKVVGAPPEGDPKFVLIAAPHTSNWDLPLMLATTSVLGFKMKWTAKKSIFRGPFGVMLKRMGGIPIDRGNRHNIVNKITHYFNASPKLILAIQPEGTRKKEKFWKSGFYHIALNAKVPVVCSFLDYKKKQAGLGPAIYLTGDVEKDLDEIRDFYKNISGKFPESQSEIAFQ